MTPAERLAQSLAEFRAALLARIPCHWPGCRKLSARMSNYCAQHGREVRRRYETRP
jgi:hypothetical protein